MTTRAARHADAATCLSQARKNLDAAKRANDGSAIGDSRVHRAEQAVKAWEDEIAEIKSGKRNKRSRL